MNQLDVAVTLLTDGDRILVVWNPNWSVFTLPMTKRRVWQDPAIPPAHREESWLDAAARAAGEWLGCTFTTDPKLIAEFPEYQQSDRDGTWKRYRFQIFRMDLAPGDEIRPGAIAERLTKDEILDPNRRPISSTARNLIVKI
jgi:hypothetical protein